MQYERLRIRRGTPFVLRRRLFVLISGMIAYGAGNVWATWLTA